MTLFGPPSFLLFYVMKLGSSLVLQWRKYVCLAKQSRFPILLCRFI